LHRLNELSAELMDPDLNVRAHVLAAQANFFRHIQNMPYQLFIASRESARAFRVAGNRPIEMIMGAHEGKALLDLGQWAESRAVLAATLAQAELIQGETPLGYSRAYMARILALSEVPADWAQAEEHARKLRSIQNQAMLAQAELALARVHYNRG